MKKLFRKIINELKEKYPSINDETDYYVEIANKIAVEGKNENHMCELFDSVLKDISNDIEPRDAKALVDYVGDENLVYLALYQHLELQDVIDAIRDEYDKAYEKEREQLPKA